MKSLSYDARGASYKAFFKALSNNTRLDVLRLLRKGPANVSQICKALGFEQSRVSHNLALLEAWGFVASRHEGKKRVYSLQAWLVPVLQGVEKHVSRYSRRLNECGVLKGKHECKFARGLK